MPDDKPEITLRTIAEMLYLLGYFLFWLRREEFDGKFAMGQWQEHCENWGVRKK